MKKIWRVSFHSVLDNVSYQKLSSTECFVGLLPGWSNFKIELQEPLCGTSWNSLFQSGIRFQFHLINQHKPLINELQFFSCSQLLIVKYGSFGLLLSGLTLFPVEFARIELFWVFSSENVDNSQFCFFLRFFVLFQ